VDLLLIRHALPLRLEQPEGTLADPSLSEEGRRQAQQLAAWLAREPIEAVYASPLRRARETAERLAGALALEVRLEPALVEFNRQSSRYVPLEEIQAEDPERYRVLVRGALYAGVDLAAFRRRVCDALGRIACAHPGSRAAVVCHGGVVNAWAADVLGLEATLFFQPGYASISRFRMARSGERGVSSLGETAYLHPIPA